MDEGLARALGLGVGHGYLEGAVLWDSAGGALARVEGAYHPLTNLGLFAFAQTNGVASMAGAGVRLAL